MDKDETIFQHYQADPVVRELYVGYRLNQENVDRNKPVLFLVTQNHEVFRRTGKGREPLGVGPGSTLLGRPQGSSGPIKVFLDRWEKDFKDLCEQEKLVEVFRIVQGCVIETEGGHRFQFRNFDKGAPWMRPSSLKGILRVYRSPLRAISDGAGAATGPQIL